MSSYKDTFEPNTFEANSFACGTWRGTGAAVIVPSVPGAEWRVAGDRMHYACAADRMHFRVGGNDRPHYNAGEE